MLNVFNKKRTLFFILVSLLILSCMFFSSCEESSDDEIYNGIVFEDAEFVYDGTAKTIVATNIPEGVTVSYTSDECIDAGTYYIVATASAEGHDDKRLIAKLTINKATYDMSSVTFTSQTFVYNGQKQYVIVSGNVPEGLTVKYQNNGKTDIGTYKVIAGFFDGDWKNYEEIPTMEATLTIVKGDETAKYSITYNYNGGSAENITEYTQNTETFTLQNPTKPGCTFMGWSEGKTSLGKTVTIQKGTVGNRTFTANWYNFAVELKSGCYVITGVASDATELTIPQKLDGITINGIATGAFSNCPNLTSLNLPDTITFVEANAFSGCTALENAEIELSKKQWQSLVNVGAGNENLTSILKFGKSDTELPGVIL